MAYRPNDSGGMPAEEPATELASPWVRLAAVIIDGLIVLGLFIIVFLAGVVSFGLEGGLLGLLVLIPVYLAVLIVQMILLAMRGQTIGKIILRIRIVDSVTGAHAGWARLILLRTLVQSIIASIPFIGFIYALVDALFIFRADHRTIHDLIAGTRVDKVSN